MILQGKHDTMSQIFFILVLGISLNLQLLCSVCSAQKQAFACQHVPRVFRQLAKELVSDGFDSKEICRIFSHPKVRFNPKVMPRKVTHNEAALHYDIFLQKDRIERAKRYLQNNRKVFDLVEKEYGIPKEIKVAILLVETDLGRYLGSDIALNNLASMAVVTDTSMIKRYSPDYYKSLKKKDISRLKKRLREKSRWAYSELKSLIIYSRLNGLDIHQIKGSIFGAIGLCQFMPSNALKFGVDFNKDGRVDLFDPEDAIASMANYLHFYGWSPEIPTRGQIRVIKQYNHSTPYAKTVLKVAQKIRQL